MARILSRRGASSGVERWFHRMGWDCEGEGGVFERIVYF